MKAKALVILFLSSLLYSQSNLCFAMPDSPDVSVKVDQRMELYFVTAYMSESFFKRWISNHDADYARDIEDYFASYKAHPAIRFFEESWKKDMSSYIPPEIMIYLDENMDEQKDLQIPQNIIEKMGGIEKKDAFLKNIKDFYQASQFNQFFDKHFEYYRGLSSQVEQLIIQTNCIQRLTDFYGKTQNQYTVLLVPLLGAGSGYGPSLPGKNGKDDLYCLFTPYQTDEQILNMLWHEFGHSFVNPVVTKNRELVKQSEHLFDPIASSMQPLYNDWENSLSEHLVKVNTSLLIKSQYGEKAAEEQIARHESRGFIYMRPLTNLMDRYQKHPKKYKSFEDYLPYVAKKLKSLNIEDYTEDADAGFAGPINKIAKEVTHIVVPTNELNDSINGKMRDYAVRVEQYLEKQFGSEIKIITDKEALEADLSAGDVYIFGTLSGNLWLKAHAGEFPFEIASDYIKTDKVVPGDHLRLMSAWPHFQDRNRGMAIFTAQKAEDIFTNGLKLLDVDYAVLQGAESLAEGKYKKKPDRWMFK